MIVKHVPMRVVKKSNFGSLISYLTHPQNKAERVGCVTVTNCYQSTALDAVFEIEAIQALNTRAQSDKTYHIIISFRAGENPGAKVLTAIEQRICDSLGFRDHQRISAVHHDTDNLHIHVAINKIHPTRHTIYEPYYDYKKLAKICEKLEIDYGLARDNHQTQKRIGENRAEDMERHTGIESLLGYIKRECVIQMKAAETWAAMHQVLHEHALFIREQGNGLVVIDQQSGEAVKASSIDRALSKSRLEQRLGPFIKPQSNPGNSSKNGYSKRPVYIKTDTTELYARYQAAQQNVSAARHAEIASARTQKNQAIEKAKNMNRLKRATIKLLRGRNKKLLYSLARKSLQKNIDKAQQDYLKNRQAIYAKYERCPWADWLKKQALAGDSEALTVLRAREGRENLKGNTIGGQTAADPHVSSTFLLDSITKKGTIIYRAGNSAIRDDGQLLQISNQASQQSLETLLQIAMQRYGKHLSIHGSQEFKKQIVQVAVNRKWEVTFDDAPTEQLRKFFVRLSQLKEQKHEPEKILYQQNRGRENRGSAYDIRRMARNSAGARTSGSAVRTNAVNGRIKSNTAWAGSHPPPSGENRLRNLSQLAVVRFASRSEMLLQTDVRRHLEHQRAKPDHSLRRDISKPGIAKKKQKKRD